MFFIVGAIKMPDVILLGDINIDINATMPLYPARGGEGVASNVEYHTGGSVVSTSVALAKLGASTGVIGRVGKDALAAQVMRYLDTVDVDRSHVQVDNMVSTGLIYIVVNPDGERTMFAARGANVFTQTDARWPSYFASARWYHFSGYALLAQPQHDSAIHALKLAQHNHCRVSLDPNPEPAMRYGKQIKTLLPKIDVFFPNEQELMVLTNGKTFRDAVNCILDEGAKAVVIKRGKKGCVIAYDKVYLEIPSFEIKVKNTTGAGDSFNAGVLLGRMVGLSWVASAILGNALGAIASSMQETSALEITPSKVLTLIERDMFKPQWMEWHWALEQLSAYLSDV